MSKMSTERTFQWCWTNATRYSQTPHLLGKCLFTGTALVQKLVLLLEGGFMK